MAADRSRLTNESTFGCPRLRSAGSGATTNRIAARASRRRRPGSADPGIPLQRDQAAVWAEHSAAEPSALQDDPADLPALFDAVAARWPDAKALVCRTGEATFRELDRSSRALAAMLQAHGAAHGEIVAFW